MVRVDPGEGGEGDPILSWAQFLHFQFSIRRPFFPLEMRKGCCCPDSPAAHVQKTLRCLSQGHGMTSVFGIFYAMKSDCHVDCLEAMRCHAGTCAVLACCVRRSGKGMEIAHIVRSEFHVYREIQHHLFFLFGIADDDDGRVDNCVPVATATIGGLCSACDFPVWRRDAIWACDERHDGAPPLPLPLSQTGRSRCQGKLEMERRKMEGHSVPDVFQKPRTPCFPIIRGVYVTKRKGADFLEIGPCQFPWVAM